MDSKGARGGVWSDENILYYDHCSGYIIAYIFQSSLNCNSNLVNLSASIKLIFFLNHARLRSRTEPSQLEDAQQRFYFNALVQTLTLLAVSD